MALTYEAIKSANERVETIELKGKRYASVAARVQAFRELCPDGAIVTDYDFREDSKGSFVICKTTVIDETGKVLATGMAYEREGSTQVNRTSYIENCVPLDTQILTKDGWRFYNQLKVGDVVYGVDLDTQAVVETTLEAVNIHENRPLVRMRTSMFAFVCTPQHKWVTTNQSRKIEKVATEDLKVSHKIMQAFPQQIVPSDKGRRLGWLICDCEINKTGNGLPSTAYIHQSKHISEVARLFGEGTKTKVYNRNWLPSYEWRIPANQVREILGEFRIASYADLKDFALNADSADVAGCYESMMLADGTRGRFSSTYLDLVEAVQIMCVRLGIATTFVTSRMMKNSTRPLYELGIKTTSGAYASEIQFDHLPPKDVWCPTTGTGTWFAKQGNFVTLTSNCETSAVGRALGMIGLGSQTSMATAEEMANALYQQNAADQALESATYVGPSGENDAKTEREEKMRIIVGLFEQNGKTAEDAKAWLEKRYGIPFDSMSLRHLADAKVFLAKRNEQ